MKIIPVVSSSTLPPAVFIWRMACCVLLINLFVIVLTGFLLRQSRLQDEDRAAVTTRNLTMVLEQSIGGSLDKTDMALCAVIEEIGHQYARGGLNGRELNALLSRLAARLPELDRISTVGADGRIAFCTGVARLAPTYVADRDYFKYLRDNPKAGLFMTGPVTSRISGTQVIILARRINRADGSFGGVICGSIPVEHFRKLFSSIDVGKHGTVSLRDGEFRIISRYPPHVVNGRPDGGNRVPNALHNRAAAGRASGTFNAPGSLDGVLRTYSFRRISNYPLYVMVGLAVDDYLAAWRGEVAKMSVTAALFFLITLFISGLIYRNWKRGRAAVRTLAMQEEKFRTIADYTHDWEFWLGPGGEFIHTSPSCERITGYRADTFYADPSLFYRIVHPDDRELLPDRRHEEHGGTGADTLTFRILHADGSVRWLEQVSRPIVNESGIFLGTRGSNRDITERRQTEEELLLTKSCMDKAAIGIYNVSEDGSILSANDYACRSLGYSKEEMLALKLRDIDPVITREKRLDIKKSLDSFGFATLESVHRRKDGTTFPVEITTNIVEFNDKRYPFSFVKDISERKAAEAGIAQSEQKFRAIFENAHEAIFLIADDSLYVDCNPAATELFACGKEEILGSNPPLFSPSLQPDGRDTAEKGREIIDATLRGEPQRFEWRHRRRNGEEFDSVVVLSRLELESRPMMVAIVRDVSKRKSLEEQLYQAQKMEAVGQLAGGVAHDFNNILTAMIGFAHLMSIKMAADDPCLNYVKQMAILAERGAELTQGLLAFSRKQVMVQKPVDLNGIVVDLQKMLSRLIPANIELRLETCRRRLIVMADRGKVEQVLMNLATNARDAMAADGTITIKTSVLTMTDRFIRERGFGKAGDYACVTVSDTGCGMNEETQRKIFEPFFTTKEVGKGTGLGLSIVYGIVKQHNGYVYVRSEEGKGTAFDICLPLSDFADETDTSMEDGFSDAFRGNETLLLAEDDTTLNRLHQELLEEAGYKVVIAADGEEALERFLEQGDEIDLLVLDVVMPKMNGKRVLEEVRAIRPEMSAIFVSGYTSDVLQEGEKMQEEFRLLMKPVTPGELLRNIREALDSRNDLSGGKK